MWAFKISKPNKDVLTVTDERDLIFTSDRNCLKEVVSGTVDITTNGSGDAVHTIAHGLGYTPTFYVFVRDPASTSDWYPAGDEHYGITAYAYADSTNLTIEFSFQESDTLYKCFYIIFADQL